MRNVKLINGRDQEIDENGNMTECYKFMAGFNYFGIKGSIVNFFGKNKRFYEGELKTNKKYLVRYKGKDLVELNHNFVKAADDFAENPEKYLIEE